MVQHKPATLLTISWVHRVESCVVVVKFCFQCHWITNTQNLLQVCCFVWNEVNRSWPIATVSILPGLLNSPSICKLVKLCIGKNMSNFCTRAVITNVLDVNVYEARTLYLYHEQNSPFFQTNYAEDQLFIKTEDVLQNASSVFSKSYQKKRK